MEEKTPMQYIGENVTGIIKERPVALTMIKV